jgi:hypothetical protein
MSEYERGSGPKAGGTTAMDSPAEIMQTFDQQ